MAKGKHTLRTAYLSISIALVLLFAANLFFGSISIPFKSVFNILCGLDGGNDAWRVILLQSRLPQAITALLAGASLSVAGLMLQTIFQNPLAGPSILGISDGANLGVAIMMLAFGSVNYIGTIIAAFCGALLILIIVIQFSKKVKSAVMLLIIGIMIGYLASSVISILNFRASADKVHQFVLWGMGDFSSVSLQKLPYFVITSLLGLGFSILLIKPLNALLLGENYAANLGVRIKPTRIAILGCTGLLTAATTAFCGPISFIGLAVPHIARLSLGSSNHKGLLPVSLLLGSCIALLCNLISTIPSGDVLPLNAITPIIGAPIIIYIIVNRKNIHYFN